MSTTLTSASAAILTVPRFLRPFARWISPWYSRKVTEKNFIGQVLRKARRSYLGTFYPEYIEKAIAETREGECHRCGMCCQLIYKCPFLGRDAQNLPYCRVYGDLRPTNCKTYPFDQSDSEIATCGYTFKKK